MKIIYLAVILFLVFLLMGCSRFTSYKVGVSNSSDTGIILLEFPVRFFRKKNLRPNDRSASTMFDSFKKFGPGLPDEITIVWQHATLSNCTNPEKKMGCEFTAIEGAVFEKTIDLRTYQQSDAFKELGETSKRGWPRTNTAKLKIVFTGEDVEIRAHQGSTKIWR